MNLKFLEKWLVYESVVSSYRYWNFCWSLTIISCQLKIKEFEFKEIFEEMISKCMDLSKLWAVIDIGIFVGVKDNLWYNNFLSIENQGIWIWYFWRND